MRDSKISYRRLLIRLPALQDAEEKLRKNCAKAVEAYQNKTRQHQKVQDLYQNLRKQQGHADTARAAQEQTEMLTNPNGHFFGTPQQSAPRAFSQTHPINHQYAEQLHPRQRSGGSRPGLDPHVGGRPIQTIRRGEGRTGTCKTA